MRKEFKFADLGEGITEGEIIKWFVQEGTNVTLDQPLLEIETDKAIVSIPSPYTGRVAAIHGKEGENIKVGDVLVEFLEEPVGSENEPNIRVIGKKTGEKDAGSIVGILEEAPEESVQEKEKVRAIPSVRALAKTMGIDLNKIKGTGFDGRIRKEDVMAFSSPIQESEKSSSELIETIPFRGIKKAAARRVTESVQRIPHVTFMDKVDITRLQEVREQEKALVEKQGLKLTFLPFFIKSVVAGLKRYPYLNSSLDENRQEIQLKKYYHIGIAADTPNGLMVFAIKHADQKSILELAKELSILTQKAASRTIDLKDLKGGTFTISNYGVIGGTVGTPIINYPEAAILGIGKIEDQAVVINGQITIRKIAPLSLSFDHRLVDGADAGRFLNCVIERLQDPNLLLIEGR